MAKKHHSRWNLEDLSDVDIYDAIRYLEPEPQSATEKSDGTAFVICVSIFILLLGCLGFVWLYR